MMTHWTMVAAMELKVILNIAKHVLNGDRLTYYLE